MKPLPGSKHVGTADVLSSLGSGAPARVKTRASED